MKETYSAVLTGEPFLFFETRQVACLKIKGLRDKDIREEVKKNNLFQYHTEKSINKRLATTFKRLNLINEYLTQCIAEGPIDTAKIINLYAIMLSSNLVYAFMSEVVAEKIISNSKLLERKDINEFFIAKSEQNEVVSKWSDYTIAKLKQVLQRIIFEAGILTDKSGGTLQRITIDSQFAEHMITKPGKVLLSITEMERS